MFLGEHLILLHTGIFCAKGYVRDAFLCQINCLVACLLKDCKNGEEKENGETLIREREWRDSDVR